MNLIRIVFLGLAVLLPTSWTIAKAADEAPAGDTEKKPAKKSKKSKKSDKGAEGGDKKAE